jgi:signal transduction histidine kinase
MVKGVRDFLSLRGEKLCSFGPRPDRHACSNRAPFNAKSLAGKLPAPCPVNSAAFFRGDTVPGKLGAVLAVLARVTAQACAVDRCSIFIRNDEVLVPAVSEFATGGSRRELWRALTNLEAKIDTDAPAILTDLLRSHRPRLISDLPHESGIPDEWKQFGATTVLLIPLARDGHLVGLVVLDTSASVIGPARVRRARQLARGISLVLDNAASSDMRAGIAHEAADAAIAQERIRVDRILHDGLRQTLFSMAMKIELALLGNRRPFAVRAALRALKQDAATMMAQMREVVPRRSE